MASDCFVIKPADESHGAGVLLVNGYESLEEHAQLVFRQVSSTLLLSSPSNAVFWALMMQDNFHQLIQAPTRVESQLV